MVLLGRLQSWRRLLRWGAGLGVAALVSVAPVQARDRFPSFGTVALAELPAEVARVHRQVLAGGPFAYPKDGIVFGNRERRLPAETRGFYREYTVPTPGARDRGARRLICGGRQISAPEACWFTADHYLSFQRIKS